MKTNSVAIVGIAIMFLAVATLSKMVAHRPCDDAFATGFRSALGKVCR